MRTFIAADINDQLRGRIEKLQSEIKRRLKNASGIKWVKPQLIHLTLKFLGEVDEQRIDEMYEALELVCQDYKAVELEFSKVGSFGRPPKVLWLGIEKPVDELQKLAADLEDAFEELGFEKEQREFSPHLTLARIPEKADRALPQIIESIGKIDAPKIIVDSVCFYKSQLTSDGPIYTLLNKIKLK
ncbi:MAG: 2'-5' RNA ligase [Planctomycetes bacterium GWF2_42_9]|nr:MAG: 2'-5' RNA ligase [Planctomycetes bacterium GWF2_42_9]